MTGTAPALADRRLSPIPLLDGKGMEWVVEAFGCDGTRLADPGALGALVRDMVEALRLTPVAEPQWHRFPAPGGVTGLLMLAESHLALHTFPEHRSLCLNLFCCAPRAEWDFSAGLARAVGATRVAVRRIERGYADVSAE